MLTSSGGYLKAIAHRGAREVEPSRRCTEISSTLTTTPSISCSTSWRCSPVCAMKAFTSSIESTTRKWVETGRPHASSAA